MTPRIGFAFFFTLVVTVTWGQKYAAEASRISFFSAAAVEDIAAINTKATSFFDDASDDIALVIPIVEFAFEKSLMQEHFNEKYLESDRYPTSTFVGRVTGFDRSVKGVQAVTAKGKLTMHGKTREVTVPGSLELVGEKLLLKAKFIVRLEDYQIKIPKLMWQNIAEQVEVTLDITYKRQ